MIVSASRLQWFVNKHLMRQVYTILWVCLIMVVSEWLSPSLLAYAPPFNLNSNVSQEVNQDTLQIERISFTPRSDGLGYVIRFHHSTRLDSFKIIQPASDLIQLELFHPEMDTLGMGFPNFDEDIQEIRLYELENSYGVDIYLGQQLQVPSRAYPDMQSQDLLVALSYASPREVELFTQQFLAKNWYLSVNPEDALDLNSPLPSADLEEGYSEVKDKLKFDTIIIDPGHGGHDPGNIGYRKVKEKDVAMSI